MKYILSALCLVLMCACTDTQIDDAPFRLDDSMGLPLPMRAGSLPKAETAREQQQTKADEFDIRGDYADIYGISPPFSTEVRAVAEFENTEAVLIAWEDGLDAFFLGLIESVSAASDVWVLTWDLDTSNAIRRALVRRGVAQARVRFFEFPHESFWTRDYGPISVVDALGNTSFVDPKYYPQRRRDDAVPTLMSRYFGVNVVRPPVATEGGNFMANGAGVCVVTEWLLQENPNLSAEEVQRIQDKYFGCRQTVVLERLIGEGTGHIDMFAKFLSPNTILVGEYDALDPQNAALLDRNVDRLQAFAQRTNWPLNIVRIPMPAGGGGVYRSYTNSLIVNDRVIVPTYRGDRRYESEALTIYRNALPAGYTVVALDAEDAIQLGGAVHCTTMGFVTAQLNPVASTSSLREPISPPMQPPVGTTSVVAKPEARIPDEGTIEDTITVRDSGLAFVVELGLNIEHTYLGDLVVTLERDGFQTTVLRNNGTGSTELDRTFRITIPRGIERSGEWRLVIIDTAPQDEGVLKEWSLRFPNQ